MFNQRTLLFFFLIFGSAAMTAQGLMDGFFAPKGQGSVTLSYTRSTFDEFYVGEELVGPVPAHNEISQNIYSVFAKYGLTDNLTLIASAPYISASGDGAADPVNGLTEVSGLQDVSLYAKYRPVSFDVGEGRFDVVTGVGISIPGDYEPNGILSIGSGAFSTEFKVGGQLNTASGVFVSGMAGYNLRGNADNTLGTGEGAEFDVPNAVNLLGRVGYAGAKFYAAAFIYNQNSTEGVDIMGPGFTGNFPETEVDFTSVGATVYVPLTTTFGVSASYGTLIDGRNVGDADYVNAGLTLNF